MRYVNLINVGGKIEKMSHIHTTLCISCLQFEEKNKVYHNFEAIWLINYHNYPKIWNTILNRKPKGKSSKIIQMHFKLKNSFHTILGEHVTTPHQIFQSLICITTKREFILHLPYLVLNHLQLRCCVLLIAL